MSCPRCARALSRPRTSRKRASWYVISLTQERNQRQQLARQLGELRHYDFQRYADLCMHDDILQHMASMQRAERAAHPPEAAQDRSCTLLVLPSRFCAHVPRLGYAVPGKARGKVRGARRARRRRHRADLCLCQAANQHAVRDSIIRHIDAPSPVRRPVDARARGGRRTIALYIPTPPPATCVGRYHASVSGRVRGTVAGGAARA